jgi:PAS domain S-box-containing protein
MKIGKKLRGKVSKKELSKTTPELNLELIRKIASELCTSKRLTLKTKKFITNQIFELWQVVELDHNTFRDQYNRLVEEQKYIRKREKGISEISSIYKDYILKSTQGTWRFELDKPFSSKLSVKKQIEYFYQHGYLAECNDAFARMYGCQKAEEIIGTRLSEMMKDDPLNIKFITKFIKSNYMLSGEESIEQKITGERFYVENNLIGIIQNGRLKSGWGTQRDITEKKNLESKLKESNERWQFAIDGSELGLWDWNVETNEVFFSKKWKEMLGYDENEIGNSLDEWSKKVHPEDSQKCFQDIKDHFEGKTEFYSNIHRVQCKDGGYKWILDRGKVISFSSDGKPLRVIGTHTDISKTKAIEETLWLEREMFLSGTVVVFKWKNRENWPAEYVSANVEEVLGYSANDFLEGKILYSKIIHSDDFKLFTEEIINAGANSKPRFRHSDYRLIHKEGHVVWVLDNTMIIRNESGEITHYLGYLVDISERVNTEEVLKESEKRYKKITEGLTDYFYTVYMNEGRVLKTIHSETCVFVTGYTSDEFSSNPYLWIEMVVPEDRTMVIERFEMLHKGSEIHSLEHRIIRKDGTIRWVMDTTIQHFNQKGELEFYDGVIKDITDKKHTEELLKESERKFRNIFNATHEAIFIHELNSGKILEVNESMLKLYGYDSLEELLDLTLKDLSSEIAPFTQEEAAKKIHQAVSGIPQLFEWHARRKDGTTFWAEVMLKKSIIEGEDRILAVVRDISERKLAGEVLQRSENLFRSIWENSKDGMRLTDNKGLVIAVNESFCRMVDKRQEEIEGHLLSEIYSSDEKEQILKSYIKNFIEGNITPHIERKFCLWNGKDVWFDVSNSTFNYSNNEKILLSIFRDITERKLIEQLQYEIKEEFRTTLYSIGDAVITTDTIGRIKQINPEAELLTGWREHEAKGRRLEEVFQIISEDTREFIESPVVNVIKLGIVTGLSNRTLLISKDGSEKPIADSGAPIKDQKGNITGVVIVFRDQTEERNKRRLLEESESTLKQSQYVAKLGHYEFFPQKGIWTNSEELDRIFGIEPNYEKTVQGWIDIIHLEHRDEMLNYLQNHVLRDKNSFDKEYKITQVNNGSTRWVHGLGKLEFDNDGNAVKMFGTIQDITERKVAEELRRESEIRYKLLMTSMDQGLALHQMIYDEEGKPLDYKFLDVNESYERLTGLKRENIIGKTILEVLPSVEKYWIDTYGKVALTGKSIHYENYAKGLGRYFEVVAFAPQKDQFAVIVNDISLRKRSEIEKEATIQLLAVINTQNNWKKLMKEVSKLVKEWSECEAIGIRFKEGDDYPYIVTQGFSESFVNEESSLCEFSRSSMPIVDEDGKIVLGCFCGAVINDRFQNSKLTRTENGSFWTNSITTLIENLTPQELPTKIHGKCIREGFESIALIPLKLGETILGLIQLNDRQKGKFTPERIELFEHLAENLSIAIAHKKALEELKDSEIKYRTMFEKMVQGVVYQDHEGKIFSANPAAEKILGRTINELNKLNSYDETWKSLKEDGTIFPSDEHPSMMALKTGKEIHNKVMGIYNPRIDSYRWININAIPQFKEGDVLPSQVMVTFEDITESKLAREAVKVSEEKFSKAFRTSPDAININRLSDGMFLEINEGFTNLTGYTPEDVIGKSSLDIDIWVNAGDRKRLVQILMQNGEMDGLEAEFRFKDGRIKTGLMSARIIVLNGERYILSITRDITERKMNDDKIKLSLKEKEILLKEIHHRVKNNLQIIVSLLNLQEDMIRDDNVRSIFTDVQSRIRSMSLIHELMYRTGNFAAINMKDYVENLVDSLYRTYVDDLGRIKINIDIDQIELAMDTMIPCGLIINELFSNALKYAFPHRSQGIISITLKAAHNNFTLEISDDGVGLPVGIDVKNLKSLGLHLVEILVKQISGSLEIIKLERGTKFKINFERES